MKLLWCTLHVADMARSLAFYQEVVGLKLVRRFSTPDADIAFLEDGGSQLELIRDVGRAAPSVGDGISLGFEVSSLDSALQMVAARGIPVLAGPIAPGPRTRFFFIKDPDGLTVQFVEQRG
ncbi:MAG: VOC family protein [Clostridiales bacterium]|nr:VOC family protein [Clostridiales bacterium]